MANYAQLNDVEWLPADITLIEKNKKCFDVDESKIKKVRW